MKLRRLLIPFFDPTVAQWATLARLVRWMTFLWLFIGLAILFSATYAVCESSYGDGLYYVKRQVIWVMLGLILFNYVVHSPLRKVLEISDWALLVI